jgi:hypothetical protein
MKKVFLFAALLSITLTGMAQGITSRPLKKTLTLTVARTSDDDMPGTRGASVAWHPGLKLYYASMAGNSGYPLSIFNATGKRISADDQDCLVDIRGMWYNPAKKTIQGNGYGDIGYFTYKLDAKGMVVDEGILIEGMNQPGEQCAGSYNAVQDELYFLNDGHVYFYTLKDGVAVGDPMVIHWGRSADDGVDETADEDITPSAYNNTSVIYTGIKGAELGFLNIDKLEIELYSLATGFQTKALQLPADAAAYNSFNFSYCNGMYWLFNIETRTWTGYK